MGQQQSRTAGFAGVLPSSKPSRPAASKATSNVVQPQEQPTSLPVPAVTQLDQLPVHCITRDSQSTSLVAGPSSGDDSGILTARPPPSSLYVEPESVRKARVLDEHADVCSEILDGFLFVSNLRVASDRSILDALGITHVIDCCSELSSVKIDEADDRVRLRLALRDDTREDLTPFLLFQLLPFLAHCRQSNEGAKVLIHCHQGVSRSCTVAIAFVMADQAMAFRDATAFVKQRRAISSPNAAFLCQLIQWGRDLDGFLASSSDPRVINGLYRLAPHASHDPHTLILKRCDVDGGWEESELWSRGVFVFQRLGDEEVVVWTGAKCGMEGGAMVARKLVEGAVRAKAFAVARANATPLKDTASAGDASLRVVDVRGPDGSGGERFEYAAELQWSLDDIKSDQQRMIPTIDEALGIHDEGHVVLPEDSETPMLFVLESLASGGEWERLEQYDAEELTPLAAFLLVSPSASAPSAPVSSASQPPHRPACFVWIGADFSLDIQSIVNASRVHVNKLFTMLNIANGGVDIVIERQGSESDRFWHVFELGY